MLRKVSENKNVPGKVHFDQCVKTKMFTKERRVFTGRGNGFNSLRVGTDFVSIIFQ